MCTPELQLKIKEAAGVFSKDDKEENPRDKLKVMNYITGTNKFVEDAVISRADDLYVAK